MRKRGPPRVQIPIPRGARGFERKVLAPEGTFAHTLAMVRELAGLTRSQMADALGVAPSSITRLESGAVTITETMIQRYADATGYAITLSWKRSK